jgi:glutathione synthase
MTVKVGVVMDPIHQINPRKDSTLAMLLAARERGWDVHYIQQGGLYLNSDQVWTKFHPVEVFDDVDRWFQLGEAGHCPGSEFDVILMRKDPPFDMEFVYSTYLLERIEATGTLVANRPSSIRDCNEKLFATQFPQCCPKLMVSRDQDLLKSFYEQHRDVIFKPLDGMGGTSIFRVKEGDPNINVILETLTLHGERQIMGQVFIPEIVAGDTRILLIDGEPVPYGLARIPAAGETRGNLAAGGKGVGRELTSRDLWICEQIGPVLKEKGLLFVGIDVIGDFLTEINVTCPTCIKELNRDFGLDIAGQLMDCIESKLPHPTTRNIG